AAPEVIAGGLWTAAFSMRRRLDGGYTVAQSGRGRLEITPQGLRYARNFWPTFKARRKNLRLGIGGSFLAGPEARATWTLDGESPFERTRVLDPPAVPALVRAAFDGMAAAYPALAGVKIADSWGGYIDSMPDEIPVISAVD